MRKLVSHCIALTLILLPVTLPGQDVAISMDHPDQVNAGKEFPVTVTINKGSLTDYSRFSQDLPKGLTASNVSSPNADFSFDNQRVRIIWLKLPDEDEVQVTYNIMVDEHLKGSFMLSGVFAYVVEDERKFENISENRAIQIIPSSTMDPERIVDIRDFGGGNQVTPVTGGNVSQEVFAQAIRQKPVLESSGSYLVKLLVSNPRGSKYIKIEETIPSGYIFEEVNSGGGIATSAASTVKFIWMKLPEDPEFEVAYRLVPRKNEPQEDMVIEGLLTYTRGDENMLTDVKEMDLNLEDLSTAQKRNLLQTGTVPSSAGRASDMAQNQQAQGTGAASGRTTPTGGATQSGGAGSGGNQRNAPSGATGETIVNTRVLAPGDGVYYRVQLAANRNAFDAGSFFRKAGVDREVMVEQIQGLYKYTAGSFLSYEQATAYRNQVERLSSVHGSFVVAYRDGRRIPVSSAGR